MDLAALGFSIDSAPVLKAANDLDRFSSAAEKAGAAGKSITFGNGGSIAKLVAEVQSANSKLTAIVGTLEKIASANRGLSASNDNLGRSFGNADSHVNAYRLHLEATVAAQKAASTSMAAADAHVVAYTQHLAGLARAQQDANAHVLAYQQHVATIPRVQGDANAHVLAYRQSLDQVADGATKASTAIKFTAVEGLNASRQLADIGVTAASGMSPFLIALQQGPQLFDILQQKAVATGATIGAVSRSAAASILAMAAPFLPLIAAVTLAAAGLAALTRQANDDSGLKKYTTAMGYTKEEVKKLNAVTVTFGDTTKAVFQVALRSAADALGINTKTMAATWDRFLDRLASGTRATLAGVYAAIAGTRAYLGEIEKGGVLGLGKMLVGEGDPDLLKKTYGKAYRDGQKALDEIVKQARANAQARQGEMAAGFYDAPAAKKDRGKSDAEKFADIVRDAQAQIIAEQNRAAAVGMSAQAVAEMEQRTDLLNRVQQAGIPITTAVRSEVEKLASAYADAKVSADVAEAIAATTDGIEKQRQAVTDQTALIGLYGDALARATREMEAQRQLRDSLPRGEVVVMPNLTGGLSDDIEANTRAQRMADLAKASDDARYAMDLERAGLGLTGEAALSYAYVVGELNKAKQAGIALSPAEVAAIRAAGDAYAQQRYAIDQQRQSIADAREVAKSFATDLISGLREGGNAFKSFADAGVNALNRVIDKLLDRNLDSFLDGLFKSGSGNPLAGLFGNSSSSSSSFAFTSNGAPPPIPLPNALGGVYGDPMRFANGGAFTNTIVNQPTLFRFANGGKLGEMGEAGPEAIMPLSRGPNGKLGVQMNGGGKPRIRMGDIHNTYQVSGAIDQTAIVAMVRQGGQATYDQIKRDLQSLLQQLDQDGAFAS